MKIVVFLLSIYVCIKTVSYAMFEWKTQKNKIAAIIIMILAAICLVAPILMANIRV